MTRQQEIEAGNRNAEAAPTRDTAKGKVLKLYRKIGNRAVAAALSIQSSYTRSASGRAFATASIPAKTNLSGNRA
jgi:hypothetical protein